ncbi:MAG: DUF2100 domain-containing protein [Euryarchaeota archaeon]|nr:DUF2100 domain-containing protein [Euryarchaeota archaeon]
MENFRLYQAQSLIKEAGKSKKIKERLKPPKEGKINLDLFEGLLNDIISAEEFIYSSRPSNNLNEDEAKLFCDKIIGARNKIDSILTEFGVLDRKNVEKEIKRLTKGLLILTSKSNYKKTLTKFGAQAQQIIVTGVPLDVDDMKILNPKIPDDALKPIIKKIKHVKNDIKRKMDSKDLYEVLVIVETDKIGELLAERATELYDARAIKMDNLKDITPDELIGLISQI